MFTKLTFPRNHPGAVKTLRSVFILKNLDLIGEDTHLELFVQLLYKNNCLCTE